MLSSIHHIALTVNKLKESVEWYKNTLGFTEVKSYHDENMDIVLLQLNYIKLELFSIKDKTQALPEYRKELMSDLHVIGTKHLCLQTNNLESSIIELHTKGVEFLGKPSESFFGGKYIFFKDCNGILIELLQE